MQIVPAADAISPKCLSGIHFTLFGNFVMSLNGLVNELANCMGVRARPFSDSSDTRPTYTPFNKHVNAICGYQHVVFCNGQS